MASSTRMSSTERALRRVCSLGSERALLSAVSFLAAGGRKGVGAKKAKAAKVTGRSSMWFCGRFVFGIAAHGIVCCVAGWTKELEKEAEKDRKSRA